jgi:hypothetical protein
LIKHLKKSGTLNQGTIVEVTVAQKLNQGYFPKSGCNRFRGSFFFATSDSGCLFWRSKKVKDKNIETSYEKAYYFYLFNSTTHYNERLLYQAAIFFTIASVVNSLLYFPYAFSAICFATSGFRSK